MLYSMRKYIHFLLLFSCLQMNLSAQTIIKHLEPMNWWVGMKNPNLQLLVHGDNIASYTPKIKYKGVNMLKVQKVENKNYLFIELEISPNAQAGEMEIFFDCVGKQSITHEYPLLKRKENAAQRKGFDASDVLYMVMPDRFANGNTQNDSVAGFLEKVSRNANCARHGGDIAGIVQHLDYIQNLGITALWVNPLLENNQPQCSYHGYAITDFYKNDARYGSNQDYVNLSQKCEEKQMKLIMDMVLNHCGSKHWWMNDLPTNDWLNFQNNYKLTNHRRESLHDPYASTYDQNLHANGWFDLSMPDLNQKNPFMANYLIQNTIWWIEYANLGGIRMDTYCYPDKEFMAKWSERVMSEYPNFNVVGEEWSLNPLIVADWQRGKQTANGYVSHLRSVMDFPLNGALVEALNTDESVWNQGFTKLYRMMANDFVYPNPNDLMIFGDNHDMSRFYTQLHEDYGKFQMGMAFLLTTRGIPQIFYGTEILMTNPKSDSHDEIRGEFPGGFGGDKNAFLQQNLTEQEQKAFTFTQTLLQWRKNAPAIYSGKLKHFAPENGVYVMFRYTDKQKVMLILNKNKTETTLDLAKFQEMIPASFSAKDILNKQTIQLEKKILLAPNSPLVLEIL